MNYPMSKRAPRLQPNIGAQSEQLQALTGALGAQPGKKAITTEDFASQGGTAIKARYATAAPTKDEYNALVDDMKALAALLNRLGANFTGL